MNVKKTLKTIGAGALLLAILASCGGPEILGVIPVYNGPTPTSTTYEFNKEDFLVIVSYADGTDKELEADEFEVVVEGMEEGYYILNIVYEDEHILLVDKRPGLAVHPHDGAEYGRTLIDHIQAYLYQKREWRPREENSFTPALCASMQTALCVKLLLGRPVETGTIYYFDLLNQEFETIPLA